MNARRVRALTASTALSDRMGNRLLAIETSGAACSLALFEDGHLLAARHEVIGRGHAERIIPWIADLPGGGRADAILAGCGPGSFTGVRVGIAAARALALGWGVPVHGMASLGLIAAAAGVSGPMLVAIEGGHGELFVQPYDGMTGAETGPLRSVLPEVAAQDCVQEIVAGQGAARLVAARGWGAVLDIAADAVHALDLPAASRTLEPSPIYGRAPDARPQAA